MESEREILIEGRGEILRDHFLFSLPLVLSLSHSLFLYFSSPLAKLYILSMERLCTNVFIMLGSLGTKTLTPGLHPIPNRFMFIKIKYVFWGKEKCFCLTLSVGD